MRSLIIVIRRPSATLRQRLLGNSSSSLQVGKGGKVAKPGDKGELSKLWQQLKDDIENAMAKKPVTEGGREGGQLTGGQYKRFSVIRRQVGTYFHSVLSFLHSYILE